MLADGVYTGEGNRAVAIVEDNAAVDSDITRSRFVGNTANSGGGLYVLGDGIVETPRHVITNTLFANNAALLGGGLAVFWIADTELSPCTFARNIALEAGGAYRFHSFDLGSFSVEWSIFWDTGKEPLVAGSAAPIVANQSGIEGGPLVAAPQALISVGPASSAGGLHARRLDAAAPLRRLGSSRHVGHTLR